MSSVNKIFLLGHVGSDPEMRATTTGKRVANLSLATDRYGRDDPDWHRLVMFEKTAEIAEQYVRKGDALHVEGRVEYGSYEKDGRTVYTTEIVVSRLTLLGGKRADDQAEAPF